MPGLLDIQPYYGPSDAEGLVAPGNIDLNRRKRLANADGSYSTIKSMSVNLNGVEWLIPTIDDSGNRLEPKQAVDYFLKTGRHLGAFADRKFADEYAKVLSARQGMVK